ncbi:hypothetical protein PBI_TREYKAY_41 [Mycobacterium phage TreyKay]|uniref:Uncharacterized protein n=1 Tax=Mycobacterium phage Prithvi TaxID=2484215 RepID=A0A3G3M1F9_9CAUD|nr:hypothetical protein I5H05_gp62 [Mycobacterium phage Prithvi]ASZ75111.1 hypothetical protein PBI_TREYKAY_41 [Mycobacterium phage TreyKay]AYR00303.1 hypothetical protein PBI_PRITHVI_41 [Mycobacterium phage Prithvi]
MHQFDTPEYAKIRPNPQDNGGCVDGINTPSVPPLCLPRQQTPLDGVPGN